jgi:ubiquitin-like modifier-activating enzyme ATG7
MLVELLVSILQHPLRARAPHTSDSRTHGTNPFNSAVFTHPLGGVPHQIRGFLGQWNNLCIEGQQYESCSACSAKIVGMYQEQGWEFVKKAINEKGWVEEVSGLAEVQRLAEEAEKEIDWDEEDEVDEEEGDGELL